MGPTSLRDGSLAVRAARSSAAPVRDLEEFWPSRRWHAYDELCR